LALNGLLNNTEGNEYENVLKVGIVQVENNLLYKLKL